MEIYLKVEKVVQEALDIIFAHGPATRVVTSTPLRIFTVCWRNFFFITQEMNAALRRDDQFDGDYRRTNDTVYTQNDIISRTH